MELYKQQFIEFMLDSQVLRFGDFVTKSGRNTPFFINAGNFSTGQQLLKLGEFYAKCIVESFSEDIKTGFDVIFGPAYKGIPLSVAASIALARDHGINVRFAADRKEEKDHGEGGKLLGGPIREGDRVLIIEDVTTAGTSIRETHPIIKANGARDIFGLVISVDRMEKGSTDISAIAQIEQDFSMKVASIVNMQEVVDYLKTTPYQGKILIDEELSGRIEDYYARYGA